MRTNVNADRVSIRLRPLEGSGQAAVLRPTGAVLPAAQHTTLALPPVPSGVYDLTITARETASDDPMGVLNARIRVVSSVD